MVFYPEERLRWNPKLLVSSGINEVLRCVSRFHSILYREREYSGKDAALRDTGDALLVAIHRFATQRHGTGVNLPNLDGTQRHRDLFTHHILETPSLIHIYQEASFFWMLNCQERLRSICPNAGGTSVFQHRRPVMTW